MMRPRRSLLTLVGVLALSALPRPAQASAPPIAGHCLVAADSALLKLHRSGRTFADFLGAAVRRREGWLRIADSARVDDALVRRARAVGGEWKLLVIAVDACGDSMNSVPYLASLAEAVPELELRIVLPTDGQPVQAAHRSLDGRLATPTIVLLDAAGRDVGCIVELPRAIRRWATAVRGQVSSDSLHAGIRTFYQNDRGRGITTELVELLEAARAGQALCDRGR